MSARDLFNLYDSFCDELTGKALMKKEVVSQARSEVVRRFATLRPVLPQIGKSVESYRVRFRKWENAELRRNTEKALRLIPRGEVVDGPVNPARIILELARGGRLQFSAEIAAILTLWNEYLRTYRDESAFA